MTEQEKFYETMNVVVSPIRFLIDSAKMLLLVGIAAGIGLFYPLVQLANHEPLSLASILVPVLTALAIFTLFYAPCYTLFFGIICIVGFAATCGEGGALSNLTAEQTVFLIFAFFIVGILQRYLRDRLRSPKKRPRYGMEGLCDELNQDRLKRLTLKYQELPLEVRKAMIVIHGDNYLTWPEPW